MEKTNSTKRRKSSWNDDEFINSEGGIPSFRRKLVELYDKKGIGLSVLEPGVFDHGVKRFGKKKDGYVVVYDYDKTAEALAKDYMKTNKGNEGYSMEEAFSDAYSWLDYNTIRSLPYMGISAPKVVYTDEDGNEHIV